MLSAIISGNSAFKNLKPTFSNSMLILCSDSPSPSAAFLELNSLSFLLLFYLTFYFLFLSISYPISPLNRYMFLNSLLHFDFQSCIVSPAEVESMVFILVATRLSMVCGHDLDEVYRSTQQIKITSSHPLTSTSF